jgi:type 1 glutamine amidotransferase
VATNLLISGGPIHDFDATSAALEEVLARAGLQSTIFDDPHAALAALADHPDSWDLVTVNALRWQIESERHAHLRERWAFTLGEGEAETLERHVRAGGGLLACHTAALCFDGNRRWAACIGATWNWDRSSHPPEGPARISPTPAGRVHPLTAGITEFTIVDEIYGFLDQESDLDALLTSRHGDTDHPVLWARTVDSGRVVTDLLGHSASAIAHPDHCEILRRAALWLTASEHRVGSNTTP